MKVLDCESTESMYDSLEKILGVNRGELQSIFNEIDLEQFYQSNPHHPEPPSELLLSAVKSRFSPMLAYDQACWFHATRIWENNKFEEGIQPLPRQLEYIWPFLQVISEAIPQERWDYLRRAIADDQSEGAKRYNLFRNDKQFWGPFAYLVREHAFLRDPTFVDPFKCPEIVEDICAFFGEHDTFDLLGAFRRNTKPCVVKFIHDKTDSSYLSTALLCLYMTHRRQEHYIQCNAGFSGEGIAVRKENILKIDWVSVG